MPDAPDQLGLFSAVAAAPAPAGLPPVVVEILSAARSLLFSIPVNRGGWGIRIGPGRKWTHSGHGCCAVSALLIVRGAVAAPAELSPHATAVRLLRLTSGELNSFVRGFDGQADDGTDWYRHGATIARELSL